MSDRVDERRTEQIQSQKRQQDSRTAKEKEAAGQKFKLAFAQKSVLSQKNAADNNKKQGEKQGKEAAQQQKAGGAMLAAKQGIAGRSMAERMVKGRVDASHGDESIADTREKDLHEAETETHETRSGDGDNLAEKQFDSAVDQRHGDQQQQSKDQGQSQSGQQQQSMGGQGQGGGQSQGGQGQQGQGQDRDGAAGGVGGVKAAASKNTGISATASSDETGKIIIGKSDKAAAKERISPQVLQSVVEKVYQGTQQGMQDFMVQLKDDALGGGSLRVTLKDGKLKIVFSMKEASAKNLLESQKGVLMRMFERKGLALESLEVKVRGEA